MKKTTKYNWKSLVTLCVLLLEGIVIKGQTNFDLRLGTRTGYEYNVFNAHPDKIIKNDGESENALRSGYFQNLNIKTSLKLKSEGHSILIEGAMQKDYFPKL